MFTLFKDIKELTQSIYIDGIFKFLSTARNQSKRQPTLKITDKTWIGTSRKQKKKKKEKEHKWPINTSKSVQYY